MKLGKILKGIEYKTISGHAEVDITGIAYNSNEVSSGNLFAALRGETADGHRFIGSALEHGASAALIEAGADPLPAGILSALTVIEVADTKEAFALASANFYGDPTRDLTMVGVTGTNGKTTITYLMESIWHAAGRNPGIIGTIESRWGEVTAPSALTTPESTDLMETIVRMAEDGVDCIAMEVSSHALSRGRVSGCHFDASIFSNLSQDHLDYHGTMEKYFAEKKKLFTNLSERSEKARKYSIINVDDDFGRALEDEAKGEIITYSKYSRGTSVHCLEARIDSAGIEAAVATPWGSARVASPLLGEHNLYNILAAAGCALALGASIAEVERGVEGLKCIPGRLESVENERGLKVLVDYAHTPDALEKVLASVRPLTTGRVILVFGCGGDRDERKRPLMGKIGRELSDVLVVTSDNPRTERPEGIIDQIERGFSPGDRGGKPYWRIENRGEAIRKAISVAEPGDTVVIAGKGHEDYQIIGETKHHFDDREAAREILKNAQ